MKKYLFVCIAFLLPLMAGATEDVDSLVVGDEVVADLDGVEMMFTILDTENRTVQIGNGRDAAISKETSGLIVLPSEVTLGDVEYSVVSIGASAFASCALLTAVEIPASITVSGLDAFSACIGLEKVVVSDLGAWCGITFDNISSNPLYFANHLYSDVDTEITDLVIPDSVAKIGNYAFAKCNIKSVTIPGSVKEVYNNAFYLCETLDSVSIAEGVERIWSYTFCGCTSLKELILPDGMRRIGTSAFYGCSSLETVLLPSSLTGIGQFSGIGDYAFKGCSNLRCVTSNILVPVLAIGRESFASLDPDCILYIPVGKMTLYIAAGWTKRYFGGGIIELGEVDKNLNVENPVAREFMANVVYPDDDYSFTRVADYTTIETKYRKDLPWPVRIEAPLTYEGEKLILEIYTDEQMVRSDTFMVGQRALEIWNLIPKTSYTYKLYVDNSGSEEKPLASGIFRTEGQVRMLNIENVNNFRDIGGWALPHGRHVRYDRLFRSAELEQTIKIINAEGIREMLSVQGIEVEIDFGDFSDNSPVGDLLEFVHGENYQIKQYANGIVNTPAQYKNCFEKVVESLQAGKKILFHCSEGADRTGTFAFLLEGLLGVSESDLAKDYELTDFYMYKKTHEDNKRCRNNWYKEFIDYVKSTYTGNTLNEKIEQMALGLGITQESINTFRSLMTDGDYIGGTNILAAADTEVQVGKKAVLPIELTNEDVVRLCHFDLRLPKGVTVATKSNGKLDVKLTERAENYSVKAQQMENGDYSFFVASADDEDLFTDSIGTLMEITLEVPDTMAVGDYEVKVLNTELSVDDGIGLAVVKLDDAESTLTVCDVDDEEIYTLGDVNNDGTVSVTDVGCTINYVLEQEPSVFIFEAADLNGDSVISVTDVGMIVNLILNDGAASRLSERQTIKDAQLSIVPVAGGYDMMLQGNESFIGFQFDVELVDDSPVLSVAPGALLSDDHLLTCRKLTDGKWRVLCYSPTNSTFTATAPEASLLGLPLLTISTTRDIVITDIRFTTATFDELCLPAINTVTTGIASVEQGMKMSVQGEPLYRSGGFTISVGNVRLYIIDNKKIVIR